MKKYIPNSKEYYVDIYGDVYSKYRKLNKNNQHTGYKTVVIRYLDGSLKLWYVHRLVAGLFIDNPENKPVVNHINLDKSDNNVSNLEWVTYSENSLHAESTGATRDSTGAVFQATHTVETIKKVCEMLQDGRRNIDIVKETGVNRNDVYMIRAGKNWPSISKNYVFRKKSRQRKVSSETIHWVCKQILEGKTNTEIAKMLDNKLTHADISKIKVGDLYKDIAYDYFTI